MSRNGDDLESSGIITGDAAAAIVGVISVITCDKIRIGIDRGSGRNAAGNRKIITVRVEKGVQDPLVRGRGDIHVTIFVYDKRREVGDRIAAVINGERVARTVVVHFERNARFRTGRVEDGLAVIAERESIPASATAAIVRSDAEKVVTSSRIQGTGNTSETFG